MASTFVCAFFLHYCFRFGHFVRMGRTGSTISWAGKVRLFLVLFFWPVEGDLSKKGRFLFFEDVGEKRTQRIICFYLCAGRQGACFRKKNMGEPDCIVRFWICKQKIKLEICASKLQSSNVCIVQKSLGRKFTLRCFSVVV